MSNINKKEFTSHGEKSDVIRLAELLFIHQRFNASQSLELAESFKREAGLYMLGRGQYAEKKEGGE